MTSPAYRPPPTPFVVLGDHPGLPTGLARITRDLTYRIVADVGQGHLPPLDLVQVGWREESGYETGLPWPVYTLGTLGDDWGAAAVEGLWQARWGTQPGVVFAVWDPIRVFPLAFLRGPWSLWAYLPIDAVMLGGGLTGPAAAAVQRVQRVLGYGRWGSQVLRSATSGPVPYLPHGMDLPVWSAELTAERYARTRERLGARVSDRTVVIGTVAANQPRKDWATVARTLRLLLDRGYKVHGWWHTDQLVGRAGAWSLVQLVEDAGIGGRVTVTTEADRLTDADLAALYQCCRVTIAPGLGEGFGYPIVESLAAGTPVVHSTYAGGAELVPRPEWKIPVRAERVEGLHAVVRPVYAADDMANAVERALRWREAVGEAVCREYCRGAVAHLGWGAGLWQRWRTWVRTGLEGE